MPAQSKYSPGFRATNPTTSPSSSRAGNRTRNVRPAPTHGTVGALYVPPQNKWRNTPPGYTPPASIANLKQKPSFVPVGFDASIFYLNSQENINNPGQIIRRNYLDTFSPKLQKAIRRRDIFAYNSVFEDLREGISRTTGGPKLPKEMPDPMEARRRARLKRRQPGSRELNLGLM